MRSQDILLCHPVRTAISAYNGALKGVPATELGATVCGRRSPAPA